MAERKRDEKEEHMRWGMGEEWKQRNVHEWIRSYQKSMNILV